MRAISPKLPRDALWDPHGYDQRDRDRDRQWDPCPDGQWDDACALVDSANFTDLPVFDARWPGLDDARLPTAFARQFQNAGLAGLLVAARRPDAGFSRGAQASRGASENFA